MNINTISNKLNSIIRPVIVFWIYLISIILLVVLPLNSAGEINHITILRFRGDYFLHALLFIPWMFFYPTMKIKWVLWFVFGILFATCSEAIQYLLPYRSFNINDLVANFTGVILSLLITLMIWWFKDL